MNEIDLYSTNDAAVKMLVGNKSDLAASRVVTRDEALSFAKSKSMLYLEASAKQNIGIEQAFHELLQKILDVPALVCSLRIVLIVAVVVVKCLLLVADVVLSLFI